MTTQDTHSHLHLVPRYSGRIPLEQIPWWEDLKEVARLYRWLDTMLNEAPVDVPRFIEQAKAYEEQYRDMLMWTRWPEHPKPGEAL